MIQVYPLFLDICQLTLRPPDGKQQQVVSLQTGTFPIIAASISDPYIVICRADGSATLFVGDTVARSVTATSFTPDTVSLQILRTDDSLIDPGNTPMPGHRDLHRRYRYLPYL